MHIMGILNVTPDSFSDGGEHLANPVADAIQMINEGATIIDIGGQSTRPGAALARYELEYDRVMPVIKELAIFRTRARARARSEKCTELSKNAHTDFLISIDTMNADIASRAISNGADIINDVSCASSPELLEVVANNPQVKYILMHSRGAGCEMQGEDYGDDVVNTVITELKRAIIRVKATGVNDDQIIIDPGLGFSKSTGDLNWPLISEDGIKRLKSIGYPVLIAASRKRFIADMVEEDGGDRMDMLARDEITAYISRESYRFGAWGVRVHNVLATKLQIMQTVSGMEDKANVTTVI